jgi:hypothetical protein
MGRRMNQFSKKLFTLLRVTQWIYEKTVLRGIERDGNAEQYHTKTFKSIS